MKQVFRLSLFFFIISSSAFGQNNDSQEQKGQVTFVTSRSIYVKFENTANIAIGDTLLYSGTNAPCLLVVRKSSTSTVCTIISGCPVKKDDEILFNYQPPEEGTDNQIVDTPAITEDPVDQIDQLIDQSKNVQEIKGRISASSYSNINSDRTNRQRVMTRLSLSANHINNSKFSFDTYLNYRKVIVPEGARLRSNDSFFRVYNLAVRYDHNENLSLILGRKINQKISSVGAIDGIQTEQRLGDNYIGAIAGFRPDIQKFGLNTKLLQYGAYIGRQTSNTNSAQQTTLGIIEQRNGSAIDRRYVYFQHSSTISNNLNLFSSAELDLFNNITNELRLTNLFISARYRVSRKLNFMLSFDSRKRVLYYETFQNEIERLLDQDLARQGLRARVNFRPVKNLIAGISYSKRFQNDNENESNNIYGYATLSRIPNIGGRFTVSYNSNKSNFLESTILSFRHSRSIIKSKLNGDFYFRMVDYNYASDLTDLKQNYFGASFAYHINRKLTLSLLGEMTTFEDENNLRIYTKIAKRFYKKGD